jgi:hypothetical protein
MNNKKESDLLYFEDTFIKTYVYTIKRGILELCNKEEYKDGFRISYIPLDDNIKQKIINNKTFVKDLCEKVAPKFPPYSCEIVIETQNEDDLEDLKITTIYFFKYECKPPLVTAKPINLFMMRNK